MSNVTIPMLPQAVSLTGAEQMEAVQSGGTTVRVTTAQIAAFGGPTGPTGPSGPSGGGPTGPTGAAGTPGSAGQFVTITSSTFLSPGSNAVLVNAASGSIIVTLPTAVGSTFEQVIKRIDSSGNSVTIATAVGGQTIDNSASISIGYQYTCVTLLSDNFNWWIT